MPDRWRRGDTGQGPLPDIRLSENRISGYPKTGYPGFWVACEFRLRVTRVHGENQNHVGEEEKSVWVLTGAWRWLLWRMRLEFRALRPPPPEGRATVTCTT